MRDLRNLPLQDSSSASIQLAAICANFQVECTFAHWVSIHITLIGPFICSRCVHFYERFPPDNSPLRKVARLCEFVWAVPSLVIRGPKRPNENSHGAGAADAGFRHCSSDAFIQFGIRRGVLECLGRGGLWPLALALGLFILDKHWVQQNLYSGFGASLVKRALESLGS